MGFDEHQDEVIKYISLFSAILSIFGCLLLTLSYFLFQELRSARNRIVLNLSIADFLLAVGWVLIWRTENHDFCKIQGIFIHFGVLSSSVWNLCMSIYSLDAISVDKSPGFCGRTFFCMRTGWWKEHGFSVFFILSWITPCALVAVSVISNFYGATSGDWCFVTNMSPEAFSISYGAAILCLACSTSLSVYVALRHYYDTKNLHIQALDTGRSTLEELMIRNQNSERNGGHAESLSSSRSSAAPGIGRAASFDIRCLLYPTLCAEHYALVWLPAIANRVYAYTTRQEVYILYFLNALCFPLVGFINFVVFGMTSRIQGPASLEELLSMGPVCLSYFRQHCESKFVLENLLFLIETTDYKLLFDDEDIKFRAKAICDKYLRSATAAFLVNVDDTMREEIERKVDRGLADRDMFDRANAEVFYLLSKDVFPRFAQSSDYAKMLADLRSRESVVQRPLSFGLLRQRLLVERPNSMSRSLLTARTYRAHSGAGMEIELLSSPIL